MKKLIIFAVTLMISNDGFAAVGSESQKIFSDMLNQVGLRNYWAQEAWGFDSLHPYH